MISQTDYTAYKKGAHTRHAMLNSLQWYSCRRLLPLRDYTESAQPFLFVCLFVCFFFLSFFSPLAALRP